MSGLMMDLYELTMAQAYEREGLDGAAVFELYFRRMPAGRGYVIAAGLDAALAALEGFRFSDTDRRYLSFLEQLDPEFVARLSDVHFSGDVWAVTEGTAVFENEPLVQVVAPLAQAQLVETLVLNPVHFQSTIASKAARVVDAAAGRTVVDFGARRAHGLDAALGAARAAYIAGAAGTSNLLAGERHSIPVFGTMAHSYVQAHASEEGALRAFAGVFPNTTLLVDTYDTERGVQRAIEVMNELAPVAALRLYSGDLLQLSRGARRALDEAGYRSVEIFASSGLDEHAIAELVRADAPIDGFGVGTALTTSEDAPALDMAYKLVEYAGRGRTKLSSEKVVLPGRKQVFRQRSGRDVIAQSDESPGGIPLLQAVMRDGRRTERVRLEDARQRAALSIGALPAAVRRLRAPAHYPVDVSARTNAALSELRRELS